MEESYVTRSEEGVYRMRGTRVSLDSVVYRFLQGETPETIAQAFPVLSLEQVYGAVAYYLANREAVNAYLEQGRSDFEAQRREARDSDPAFYQKLAAARRREPTLS